MKDFLNFKQVALQTIKERRVRNLDNVCSYGIGILDNYLGGICENELVVIGAGSGIGKTEIACQIAIKNAMKGKKVALLSLEGDMGEIIYRYMQREINKNKKFGFIKPQEYRLNLVDINQEEDKVFNNIPKELEENLFIFNKNFIPNKQKLLELIKEIREEVDIFIIDHLHYLDYDIQNEFASVSDIVRSIKETTEITKKPIVLISHLNRNGGKRGGLPNKYDLHGSSNIEKNANTIILLCPSEENEYEYGESIDNNSYNRKTKIIIDKSRIGLPCPAMFETTFSLIYKEYLEGEKYNYLSKNLDNKISEKDKIFK